jgi:hypothetical protein
MTKPLLLAGAMVFAIGTGCFADGPYKSLDDAKLARSTIGACPEKDPSAD